MEVLAAPPGDAERGWPVRCVRMGHKSDGAPSPWLLPFDWSRFEKELCWSSSVVRRARDEEGEGRVPVSRHHRRALSHRSEEEDAPRANGAGAPRIRRRDARLRLQQRARRRVEVRQEGPPSRRRIQARRRPRGGAHRPAHLPRLHRREGRDPHREGHERRARADQGAPQGRAGTSRRSRGSSRTRSTPGSSSGTGRRR